MAKKIVSEKGEITNIPLVDCDSRFERLSDAILATYLTKTHAPMCLDLSEANVSGGLENYVTEHIVFIEFQ